MENPRISSSIGGRVNQLKSYNKIWTRILSFNTRSRILILIILPLVILFVAYFLFPGFRQFLLSARGWFAILLALGILILSLDGIWFILYRRHVMLQDKMSKTLPAHCPFCGRDFQIEKEEHSLPMGLPVARFNISCSFCSTKLVLEYPYQFWVFTKVDTVLNSTFAWLYQGERLSREDLNLILKRQHTENAKVKLRASGNSDLVHIWFDKPTARTITKLRTGPLEKIISGDMTALTELNEDILYTVPDVTTSFFEEPSDLTLRKRESVILTVSPVRLAIQRTNQSEEQFYTKDTGSFFITNQRIGFLGKTYRTNITIDKIDDLNHQSDKIMIRSNHRKTPDYFLDLDGELVYCVIKGLLKENEVS
jgi:hypothetical protein